MYWCLQEHFVKEHNILTYDLSRYVDFLKIFLIFLENIFFLLCNVLVTMELAGNKSRGVKFLFEDTEIVICIFIYLNILFLSNSFNSRSPGPNQVWADFNSLFFVSISFIQLTLEEQLPEEFPRKGCYY